MVSHVDFQYRWMLTADMVSALNKQAVGHEGVAIGRHGFSLPFHLP